MTTILDFSEIKARDFFLKEDSYSNIDLPEYITFQKILDDIYNCLKTHKLSDYCDNNKKTDKCDGVNYKIIANKDGLYAWRPFQLIHPALYVELVKLITEKDNWNIICSKFKEFQSNRKIQCASIPIVSTDPKKTQKSEQIATWWKETEQASIKQALDFSFIYVTDITDCYGSIYTHTICWALHGKEFSKQPENRDNKKLIGCLIDMKLREMALFYEKMKVNCKKDDMGVLLSIVVDLAYNNPSTYHLCAAIISKIIECVQSDEEKINYIEKTIKKFKSLPNTGFMDIWLQRISYKISSDVQYEDKLCKLMNHQEVLLWNSDWLTGKLKQITDKCQIMNERIIEHMSPIITQKEVDAFHLQYDELDWDNDVDDD
jgi:hypothetical protein